MTPEQIGYYIGTFIGGLFVGALCGLLPFGLAKWKNRVSLGIGALITCTVCGLILGIMLAGPVAIIFSAVALIMGRKETASPATDSQSP